MDLPDKQANGVTVFTAESMFRKNLPFKIYDLCSKQLTDSVDHTHDYIQIWYVKYGCIGHILNHTYNRLVKGSIFVLPPYVTHRIELPPGEEARVYGCEFAMNFVHEGIPCSPFKPSVNGSFFNDAFLKPFLLLDNAIRPRLQLDGGIQVKIESLYEDMMYEFEHEYKYYEINIKADLLKLLAIITREYEKQQDQNAHDEALERYHDAVVAAIRHINENYSGKIYVEDLCRIAMVSQPYFSYIFRQITGKTVVDYINKLRISKAIDLLCKENSSVTDICFSVGFKDTTYFSRVFKKETGFSPVQYRNICLNNLKTATL